LARIKPGAAGSLRARYGTVVRKRYAEVVERARGRYECPRCHHLAVKRLSVGIWSCRKCYLKFAGGAYTPTTKLGEIARRAARGGIIATTLISQLEETEGKTERPEASIAEESEKHKKRRKRVKKEKEKTE